MIVFPSASMCRGIVYSHSGEDRKRQRRALLVLHYLDGRLLHKFNWCQGVAGFSEDGRALNINSLELINCRVNDLSGAIRVSQKGVLRDPLMGRALEIEVLETIVQKCVYTKQHAGLSRRNIDLVEFNDYVNMKFNPVKDLIGIGKKAVRETLGMEIMHPRVLKKLEEEFKGD